MTRPVLRRMTVADRGAVTDLICLSTNVWYQTHGRGPIFPSVEAAGIFFDEYEALDPGCGLLALEPTTGALMGSCFYHPRDTHVSLGIMNVHPNYFGRGVARALLGHITKLADEAGKPTRLVSSALNLDSYSLYTRAGFVPRQAYQDMLLTVPEGGLHARVEAVHKLRPATSDDVPQLLKLEQELIGISRAKDFAHFLRDPHNIWSVVVAEGKRHHLDGYMVSCSHPGSPMNGPGVARTAALAGVLLMEQLNKCRGRTMVFLVPVDQPELVGFAYALGAKNCEIHFHQCRGAWTPISGTFMPTFLPESA